MQSRIKWVTENATEVFNEMGTGHSEAVYESCLVLELSYFDSKLISVPISRQVPVPLKYKGFTVGLGYVDILINGILAIELKAVTKVTPKDVQQLKKYLEALDLDYGLLINFGNDLEIVEVERRPNDQTTSTTSRD